MTERLRGVEQVGESEPITPIPLGEFRPVDEVVLPETATVTEYRLSLLTPQDAVDWHVWDIYVRWCGQDQWCVTRGGSICLTADSEWVVGVHRFSLETALAMAEAELPRMRINGLTALDIVARRTDR